jgi:hypothetical protein
MSPLDAWLSQARDTAAACAGLPSGELDLTDEDAALLLDLAGLAAHESGDRRNAPLLCFVLGRATQGTTLAELSEAIHARPDRGPSTPRDGAGN